MTASRTAAALAQESLGAPLPEYREGDFAILVDTREQSPWAVPDGVHWQAIALPAGDYSLASYAKRIAVERKAPNDYLATVFGDWARFQRELVKLAALERRCIVVEGDRATFGEGRHRKLVESAAKQGARWAVDFAALSPARALARIDASAQVISGEYGVPVFFRRSSTDAAAFAFGFMKSWWRAERAKGGLR